MNESMVIKIEMIILAILLVVLGYVAGMPGNPNDDITNQCIERGYHTALYQYRSYYCADKLIIEDSYRIGDDE